MKFSSSLKLYLDLEFLTKQKAYPLLDDSNYMVANDNKNQTRKPK